MSREPVRSNEQKIVDEFVKKFYDTSVAISNQIVLDEFYYAQQIGEKESQKYDGSWKGGIQAFKQNIILNDISDNFKLIFDASNYENKIIESFIKDILENIPVYENEEIDTILKDLQKASSVTEEGAKLEKLPGIVNDIVSESEKTAAREYLYNNLWRICPDKDFDLMAMEKAIPDIIAKSEMLNVAGDAVIDGLLMGLQSYLEYLEVKLVADIRYFELLEVIVACDSNMVNVIRQMKAEYVSSKLTFFYFLTKAYQENEKTFVGSILQIGVFTYINTYYGTQIATWLANTKYLSVLGKVSAKSVLAGLTIADFAKGMFFDIIGLKDKATASQNITMFYYVNYALKYELVKKASDYISGKNEYDDACEIIALYKLCSGCQILMNEYALELVDGTTGDYNTKLVLRSEISHINNTSIEKWRLNPYYVSPQIAKPKTEIFDSLPNGYFYKILLDGYINKNDDGLLGTWDEASDYEKKLIAEEVSRLYDFGGSLINKIYFINVGTIGTNGVRTIYSGGELAIIFENANGQGLIFRFIDCGRGRDYLTFSVLSQENMECIKSGCSHFTSTYFSVDRHYRYSLNDHALDQTNEGDQSVIITNIQKGSWSYRTSYKCYFSLDISNDQYQDILNEYLLDYDNYESRLHLQYNSVIKDMIEDIWNVNTKNSADVNYIATKFIDHAKKDGIDDLRITIVKSKLN